MPSKTKELLNLSNKYAIGYNYMCAYRAIKTQREAQVFTGIHSIKRFDEILIAEKFVSLYIYKYLCHL